MKFTFKKEPKQTGVAGVANPYPETAIKLGGKQVGQICPPTWRNSSTEWRVSFAILDPAQDCGWRWVTFKKRFDSEPEARVWIQANAEALIAKGLHRFEE